MSEVLRTEGGGGATHISRAPPSKDPFVCAIRKNTLPDWSVEQEGY